MTRPPEAKAMRDAAAEIERLRAELKWTQDELDFAACEVEHFARLAFDDLGKNPPEAWVDIAASLRTELATARRDERERCAAMCEEFADKARQAYDRNGNAYWEGQGDVAEQIALTLRKMGDKTDDHSN
jgi:hypothetical protein